MSRAGSSRLLWLFLVLLCVGASCSLIAGVLAASSAAAPTTEARTTASSYPAGLERFYTQKLLWKRCVPGAKSLCTFLTVPKSYASPGKYGTFRISVVKDPATGNRSQYQGALMMNPGGPGSSGVNFVLSGSVEDVSPNGLALHEAYDFVSFDPRGVGESDPVYCLTDKQIDGLNLTEEAPITAAERATVVRNYGLIGNACKKTNPGAYRWLDTASVARDVDVLRAVMNQSRLNWYGFSYGTKIGEDYAQLFPRRVGRMVLDGVVPTDLTFLQESIDDAPLSEIGIKHYFATCATRNTCPYRSDPAGGEAKLIALMASLRSHPIPITTKAGSGKVDDGVLRSEINGYTTAEGKYPDLDKVLTPLVEHGDAAPIYADFLDGIGRRKDGTYSKRVNQFISSHWTNKCIDSPVTASVSQIAAAADKAAKIDPLTGAGAVWSAAQCLNWPAKTSLPPARFKNGGQPPILLVGSSHDITTPLSWAARMASQIKGSSLIEADNWHHTSSQGVPCVENATYRYLLTGRTPGKKVACFGDAEKPSPVR